MPTLPKPEHLRQRRNKTATRATLPPESDSAHNDVPDLPPREGGWHPMVMAWWADVWRSPMASEYLEADKRGLYRLAALEQDFWDADSRTGRVALSAEIRQASLPFGLSPIDRRRLQWEVEKGEAAADRTAARRKPRVVDNSPKGDPRAALKVS